MGTEYFAFMFALVGLYKDWGDSQLVGFVLLVIASWVVTKMVKMMLKRMRLVELIKV